MSITNLANSLQKAFEGKTLSVNTSSHHEVTIELERDYLLTVAEKLRDHADFQFNLLVDVCAVDYLDYGKSEWATEQTTSTGFDRAVEREHRYQVLEWNKPRFAVVYHLLSLTYNERLRLKVYLSEEDLRIDSVVDIWPAANWFEREAFDLYGILFKGHPDLRRILTDYGFVGHPFRKDFPLSGKVEVRYDKKLGRVVYDKVDIEPRVLVPKVIRHDDNRYIMDPTAVADATKAHNK